jgi:hypothetical protein
VSIVGKFHSGYQKHSSAAEILADEIAGKPLETYRQLVDDEAMPKVQRMALDAVMNGVYGRLL